MSWSLRKKRVFFVPFILSEGRFLFNICVLSQCIVYLNALSEYTYFYISIKKHYFIHKIVQVSLITYVHNLTDAHAIFCIFIIFYIYIFIYIYIYIYTYIYIYVIHFSFPLQLIILFIWKILSKVQSQDVAQFLLNFFASFSLALVTKKHEISPWDS